MQIDKKNNFNNETEHDILRDQLIRENQKYLDIFETDLRSKNMLFRMGFHLIVFI